MPLYDAPKPTKPHLTEGDKTLQFNHPWLTDVVRVGVGKLDLATRQKWLSDAWRLVQRAPKIPDELPADIPAKIAQKYFAKLKRGRQVRFRLPVKADDNGNISEIDGVSFNPEQQEPMVKYLDAKIDSAVGDRDIDDLTRENATLKDQNIALTKAFGERTAAERVATMRDCFEQFSRHIDIKIDAKQPKREKRSLIYRVKKILEKLGWEKRHGDITLSDIKDSVTKSLPDSENETSKRSAAIKRFFKFLTRSKARNGMGFVNDPSVDLKYKSPKKLQRIRKATGKVVMADNPTEVLKALPLYWRAVYATMCYVGVRNMELASLTWEKVDWENRIIHVLYSEVYPELKSEISPRPIRPFKQLWPILKEFQEHRLGETLVFPRPFCQTEGWIRKDKEGELKINHLSDDMREQLIKAGYIKEKAAEPQRRARRFWETSMRATGRSDLIEIMGGHKDTVGLEHYTIALPIVMEAHGDWCD